MHQTLYSPYRELKYWEKTNEIAKNFVMAMFPKNLVNNPMGDKYSATMRKIWSDKGINQICVI